MGWFSSLFHREPLADVWARIRPRVLPFAQPAIRLGASAAPTASWFGGQPRVAPGAFEWPHAEGVPLAFIAQLDLAELAAAQRLDWLPDRGALAFFYDMFRAPWGFDPEDRGHWAVRHLEQTAVDVPPPPLLKRFELRRKHLRASPMESFPGGYSPRLAELGFTSREWDAYCDFGSGEDAGTPLHQVGGFADHVQNDTMELECQLAANGVNVGDSKGYESPAGKALAPGAKDWRLLLQFDSDEDVGAMWGDAGRLYFWIREQDARERRFEDVWLVLQCG